MNSDCAVCLLSLASDPNAAVLPHCDHCFHTACLATWWAKGTAPGPSCPTCRRECSMAAACQVLGISPDLPTVTWVHVQDATGTAATAATATAAAPTGRLFRVAGTVARFHPGLLAYATAWEGRLVFEPGPRDHTWVAFPADPRPFDDLWQGSAERRREYLHGVFNSMGWRPQGALIWKWPTPPPPEAEQS